MAQAKVRLQSPGSDASQRQAGEMPACTVERPQEKDRRARGLVSKCSVGRDMPGDRDQDRGGPMGLSRPDSHQGDTWARVGSVSVPRDGERLVFGHLGTRHRIDSCRDRRKKLLL